MDQETVAIYTLSDPRNGAVRYVGVTTRTLTARLRGHLRYRGNDHRTAWVQSLVRLGLAPAIAEIDRVPIEERGAGEQRWIDHYRSQGADLTNGTRGGLGSPGYLHTAEARARMSAAKRGIVPASATAPRSAATREKMRLNAVRQMSNPEQRAAVSRIHKGKTISDEQRRCRRGQHLAGLGPDDS